MGVLFSQNSFEDIEIQPAQGWPISDTPDGQLAIDVIDTAEYIVVVAPMSGADGKDIEVYAQHDVVTIRGKRRLPVNVDFKDVFFHKECFWGSFSRTIVLPVDVKGDLAKAEYKNGVLIVKIPKQISGAKVPITIVDD